jgi:SAM-dependent methyltransferase
MKNIEKWVPTKYILKENKLKANSQYVAKSSIILADKIADFYNNAIPKYANGLLIDLGCNTVPLYVLYRKYVNEVICVDWENNNNENIFVDIYHDLNKKLPFPDNSYDTVILSDVLEHISEPSELCKEIARILKPNGHLLLNVPYYYSVHEAPFDFFRYTEFGLKYLIENSDLEILSIEKLGGIPEILTDLYLKTLKSIPILGNILSFIIYHFYLLIIKAKFVKIYSKKTAERFPFGYSLIAKKIK